MKHESQFQTVAYLHLRTTIWMIPVKESFLLYCIGWLPNSIFI